MGATAELQDPRAIRKVLLVDDQEPILRALARDFTRQGVEPMCALTADEAYELAIHAHPDVALIDLYLAPPDNGLRLLTRLKQAMPELRCVMVSGHMTVDYTVQAMRSGADDVLIKPVRASQVLHRLQGGAAPPSQMEVPTLDQVEWEHIARVLGDCNGNITHAAAALGVFRQSLQRKIQKHAPRALHPDEPPQTTRTGRRRPRST